MKMHVIEKIMKVLDFSRLENASQLSVCIVFQSFSHFNHWIYVFSLRTIIGICFKKYADNKLLRENIL